MHFWGRRSRIGYSRAAKKGVWQDSGSLPSRAAGPFAASAKIVTEHSSRAAHFNQVIRSLREERDRLASMANAFDPAIQKVST